MKKIIVLGIILVCILLMYQYPHTMLNPGILVEKHQKLKNKCLACHEPFQGISNEKCISCHKVSDIGKDTLMPAQINSKKSKVLFHRNLTNQKCSSCHTDHKGLNPENSINSFDHTMLSPSIIRNCISCHSQPSDSLHKFLTTDCNNCHKTTGWKNSISFNHEMILTDAKNNCTSCHKKPEDAFHQKINDNCNKCHSSSQWKPSTFDHSSHFQLDRNHTTQCNTCHINNNFSAFTCYGCHEHSENKIINEHNEEGIYNITNCVSCHKSGNEHDIRMNENSTKVLKQKNLDSVKEYIRQDKKEPQKEHDDD